MFKRQAGWCTKFKAGVYWVGESTSAASTEQEALLPQCTIQMCSGFVLANNLRTLFRIQFNTKPLLFLPRPRIFLDPSLANEKTSRRTLVRYSLSAVSSEPQPPSKALAEVLRYIRLVIEPNPLTGRINKCLTVCTMMSTSAKLWRKDHTRFYRLRWPWHQKNWKEKKKN